MGDIGRRYGMSDERTVSADYESMYENAIHHLEEREEAINMLKKDLQEATARADYFEREKEKNSNYLKGMIDGLKFAVRCNGVSGAEVL